MIHRLYSRSARRPFTEAALIVERTGKPGQAADVGCGSGAFLGMMRNIRGRCRLEPDPYPARLHKSYMTCSVDTPDQQFKLKKGLLCDHTLACNGHVHQLHDYIAQLKNLLSTVGGSSSPYPLYFALMPIFTLHGRPMMCRAIYITSPLLQ